MIEIKNLAEHNTIIENNQSVVLDFWAPWCGPCKTSMPLLEKAFQTYTNVVFCKVNVDNNKDIADKYQITSIPTLLYIKNGKQIRSQIGIPSQVEIKENIKAITNGQ